MNFSEKLHQHKKDGAFSFWVSELKLDGELSHLYKTVKLRINLSGKNFFLFFLSLFVVLAIEPRGGLPQSYVPEPFFIF